MMEAMKGGFTLPGEAGFEKLTLELARKWGADVIRDSDGTKLSGEIVEAGYRIYSTICIIREHNAFALAHPDAQQQTFLSSDPVMALSDSTEIRLLDGYFTEQFEINECPESLRYWQAWDRTEEKLLPSEDWSYQDGRVVIRNTRPYHQYTVSFLCYRIWEEINMYNHTTNHWTSEHLRQLDPRNPEAWDYLCRWLDQWCRDNPQTDVVRLTSLFYNFVWIFGSDMRRRNRFTDWASYDFTVSPAALDAFREAYGYALTAEDFIHQGKLQVTHQVPSASKRDYMDFIQRFVAGKARELVRIIHSHGKQAYVFYDDSWVGMEPNGPYFSTVGFDGLIKCIFSGFECRLNAFADVPVHEIRLHPYLFPVGLGGLPTFSEGGKPEKDAWQYWVHARRALMRQCVDRIGLGGYLHLTQGYPAFVDCIEEIAHQFRILRALHEEDRPVSLPCRVAVLHTWGRLRAWTCSGHFHETYMHPLIHVNEALAGLPVDVRFISFEDVLNGALDDVDVVINAGRAGDAWSGGSAWESAELVERLTRFVYEGGTFIGIGEPSAVEGYQTYFRMAHVLGIDEDTGSRVCHGRWTYEVREDAGLHICRKALGTRTNLYLTDGNAAVYADACGVPQMTVHDFGRGKGIYLSDFSEGPEASRMLMSLLMMNRGPMLYTTDHPCVDCAFFAKSASLVVANGLDQDVEAQVMLPGSTMKVSLKPMEMKVYTL